MELGRYITFLIISAILLSSCAHEIANKNSGNSVTETVVEIDDEITADELKAGLKKAKYILLGNPFLTEEEQSISTISDYKAKITEYLDDDKSVDAVQAYFFKLFKIEEPSATYNYLEPSNLAAYLYKNNKDFRGLVTADYCVEKVGDTFITGPCLSKLPDEDGTYVMPPEMTAGFIGTQAFVAKYAGAKNFRRISKVFEFALCSAAPNSGESEGWQESETETTLHPFYWNSLNQVEGMNCTSCHGAGGLNQGRLAFTSFSEEDGFFSGGQEMMVNGQLVIVPGLTINDVERDLIGDPDGDASAQAAHQLYLANYGSYGFDFETDFEPNQTKFFGVELNNFDANLNNEENIPYPALAEMGEQIAKHEFYGKCMAQHMFQLTKFGKPMGISHRPPDYASEAWEEKFKDSDYKLKSLLIEILTHPSYLNL